jgi:hypothetical protein
VLLIRVLVVLLLITQMGMAACLFTAECMQSCPDDDEHGHCPPDCQDCTCCGVVRVVMAAPALTGEARPPQPLRSNPIPRNIWVLDQVDAHEIWHIPKTS